MDLGYDSSLFARKHNVDIKETSTKIYELLSEKLPEALGFDPELKLMKGLKIVSVGWPIEGDPERGIVQLDLISVSNMEWAEFIYYSPDYKMGESKYKSAHRNWLLAAILSARREILSKDENDVGGIVPELIDLIIQDEVIELPLVTYRSYYIGHYDVPAWVVRDLELESVVS